jgi:formiminotetrahydrofolate cyclodeaminase
MDFLKEIASSSPVPAGGAAVAYTTTLAIGLIYKVILFEMGREHEPAMEKNLLTLRREIKRLMKDAEKMVKEDAEVYTSFAQSRRAGDKTGMKHHFSNIIDVSIKVMEKSDAAFIWIGQLRQIVPKQMLTHLLVASELLMGAINGTVHVVRDNIHAIKIPTRRANYLEKVDNLHGDCAKRYSELMEKFN